MILGRCVLVQFWAPITTGGWCSLATSDQPFGLTQMDDGLCSYRKHSLNCKFIVDGDEVSEEFLGLPGRVFRRKLPESTPDVQYYSSKEYPQRNHALRCNIRGSVALPVVEPSAQGCVGVLELVIASEDLYYSDYTNLTAKLCKALVAANLKSLGLCDHFSDEKFHDSDLKNALDEISEVLEVVCKTHSLRLAQCWVPCKHCSAVTYCDIPEKSYCTREVLSRARAEFFSEDARGFNFLAASSVFHLQKGQGVAGMAYLLHKSCFCRDITQFRSTEYPLVHYARYSGLASCFAICLQSSCTGNDDYILEFFLPPNNTGDGDPWTLLGSLFGTMMQHFRSLKVASGEELGDKLSVIVVKPSLEVKLDSIQVSQHTRSPPRSETFPNGGETVQLDSSDQQLMVEVDAICNGRNLIRVEQSDIACTCSEKRCTIKKSEREKRKTETSFNYEVVKQHFGRKLEDAAESLHISRSKLKRICRQHGIKRWPSRKRNKNNHSLPKLMHVNKSIKCAARAHIQTSFTTSPLPAVIGSMSWPDSLNGSNQQNSSLVLQQAGASVSAAYSVFNAPVSAQPNTPIGGMLIENRGSLKRIPHSSCADPACFDPPSKGAKATLAHDATVHTTARQDMRIVMVKASCGKDMIKFQLSSTSGIDELEEEVTKRLKLNVGSFNIKYQDEDSDWILVACNLDLWGCMDTARSLGSTTIRLLVEPITS